jgi:hypothetical protein
MAAETIPESYRTLMLGIDVGADQHWDLPVTPAAGAERQLPTEADGHDLVVRRHKQRA